MRSIALNPACFMLNSLAMGDVIAAVPVVKYMIETYYQHVTAWSPSYLVVAKKDFRPLFHFVPDSNYINFEDQGNNSWGVPTTFAMSCLNQKNGPITRNTPKHIHLAQFASLKLADMLLSPDQLNYVPLLPVDVSGFGDTSKAVILITSYRDETRAWHADYILDVARWVKSKGYLPVFIGKTDMNQGTHLRPKTSLPDDVSAFGLDLRNQTTIQELASIMASARAVVGLDSGPIHLAGTTSVPIVCGYTSVAAAHRIPYRKAGQTYAVTPDIKCISCESKWASHFWNFEKCPLGSNECCKSMKPELFIEHLKAILETETV